MSTINNVYLNGEPLSDINIPNTVTEIKKHAFRSCRATSITIPSSVTSIGKNAFIKCCGELTINCNIDSVESDDAGAFYDTNFTKITFGNNVTSIGDHEFVSCSLLEELILPEYATKFGFGAFAGCVAIKSPITIPEGVAELDGSCFYNCSNIPSISFPSTLTKIGQYVLYDSRNMSTI